MFRKILVGNDGSEGAKKALQTALTLATRDGAELHEISIEEHLPRYGALMGEVDEESPVLMEISLTLNINTGAMNKIMMI